MITKVDLITGFLGAGKTTFIKKYGDWLRRSGTSFAVIENEYGGPGLDTAELVDIDFPTNELAGGCICCTLKIAFHDMMIRLHDEGVERIIVEPSGIYEVNEFLKLIGSRSMKGKCEAGTILCVVDPMQIGVYDRKDTAFLTHQLRFAGGIILSRTQHMETAEVADSISQLERLAPQTPVIWDGSWDDMTDEDLERFSRSGYRTCDYESDYGHMNYFENFTLLPEEIYTVERLEGLLDKILAGECGDVSRVKGFVRSPEGILAVNMVPGEATVDGKDTAWAEGRKAQLNVIGNGLDLDRLVDMFI